MAAKPISAGDYFTTKVFAAMAAFATFYVGACVAALLTFSWRIAGFDASNFMALSAAHVFAGLFAVTFSAAMAVYFKRKLTDMLVSVDRSPSYLAPQVFLHRSNKLMYDTATHSLWNEFTGRPVVGPLTGSGIVLKTRPVVIASWADWKARHPGTKVLALETGHRRDYSAGAAYGRYFASRELMFPTKCRSVEAEAEGLRLRAALVRHLEGLAPDVVRGRCSDQRPGRRARPGSDR